MTENQEKFFRLALAINERDVAAANAIREAIREREIQRDVEATEDAYERYCEANGRV